MSRERFWVDSPCIEKERANDLIYAFLFGGRD